MRVYGEGVIGTSYGGQLRDERGLKQEEYGEEVYGPATWLVWQ